MAANGLFVWFGFLTLIVVAVDLTHQQQQEQDFHCPTVSALDLSLVIPTPPDNDDWNQVKQFFTSLVSSLPIGSGSNVRVSLVTYRGSAQFEAGFNNYTTIAQLESAINNLQQISAATPPPTAEPAAAAGLVLATALQTLLDNVYYTGTQRSTVPGLVVALVDDETDSASLGLQQQQTLLDMGATVYLIGTSLGAFDSTTLLNPTSYYYHCEPPATLTSCQYSILRSICYGEPWTQGSSSSQTHDYQMITVTSAGALSASGYPANYTAVWLVAAANPLALLAVQLDAFEVTQCCVTLSVFDGRSSSATQLISYTYTEQQQSTTATTTTLYSSQQFLYVRLQVTNSSTYSAGSSSSSSRRQSVSATFTTIQPCQPEVAAIFPPGGNISYESDVTFNCTALNSDDQQTAYYVTWASFSTSPLAASSPTVTQLLEVFVLNVGSYSVTCIVVLPVNSTYSEECAVSVQGTVTDAPDPTVNCPSNPSSTDLGASAYFYTLYFTGYTSDIALNWTVVEVDNSSTTGDSGGVGFINQGINYVLLPWFDFTTGQLYEVTMTSLPACDSSVTVTIPDTSPPVHCPASLELTLNAGYDNVGDYAVCQSDDPGTSLSTVIWTLESTETSGGSSGRSTTTTISGPTYFLLYDYIAGSYNISCSAPAPCNQVTSQTLSGVACPYSPTVTPVSGVYNAPLPGLTFYCNTQPLLNYTYTYQWIGSVGPRSVNDVNSPTVTISTSGFFNLTCAYVIPQCPLQSVTVSGYVFLYPRPAAINLPPAEQPASATTAASATLITTQDDNQTSSSASVSSTTRRTTTTTTQSSISGAHCQTQRAGLSQVAVLLLLHALVVVYVTSSYHSKPRPPAAEQPAAAAAAVAAVGTGRLQCTPSGQAAYADESRYGWMQCNTTRDIDVNRQSVNKVYQTLLQNNNE